MSAALELMDRLTLPFWLRHLFQAVHERQPAILDERAVAALLSWLGLARTDDGQQLRGLVGPAGSDQALLGQVFDVLDDWLFQDGQLHRQRAGVGALVPADARRRRYRLLLSAYHPDRFPDHAERLTGCSQAIVSAYRLFRAEAGAQAHAPPGVTSGTGPVSASGVARPKPETGGHRPRRWRGWRHVLQRRWGNDRWFGHKLVALLALLAFLPVLNLFLAPVPALKPDGMTRETQPAAEPQADSAAMVETGRYQASAADVPAGADTSVSPSADEGARVPVTLLAAGEGGASLPPPVPDQVHPPADPPLPAQLPPAEPALTAVLAAAPGDGSTAAPPAPSDPYETAPGAVTAGPAAMPDVTRVPPAPARAKIVSGAAPTPVSVPIAEGVDIAATAPVPAQPTSSAAPSGSARHPASPAAGPHDPPAVRSGPEPSSAPPSGTSPVAVASAGTDVPVSDATAVPPRSSTMRSGQAAEELVQRQDGLVRAYQRSIQAGDLATLGPLLAEDVRENDHDGRDALLGMYRGMFRHSQERSLTLVLRERWPEAGSWVLLADYQLSVRFPNEQLINRDGQVRYRVREEGGALVIAAIEY